MDEFNISRGELCRINGLGLCQYRRPVQNKWKLTALEKYEEELRRTEVSPEGVLHYYEKWSENGRYDKELSQEMYNGPKITAEAAASLCDSSIRSSVEILDIGAGTGHVAEQLLKHGFRIIDALDPSIGMLDKAKEKNLYRTYICDFLTTKTMQDANGSYDCVVCCGSFVPNHIKAEALRDFIRLTKKGGNIVIVMRSGDDVYAHDYTESIKTEIARLEGEGKWKKLVASTFSDYFFQKAGDLYVFQVL